MRTWFYDIAREDLRPLLERAGLEAYRAKQLWSWVYQHGEIETARMTTFNAKTRAKIDEIIDFTLPEVREDHVSLDGTRKWLVRFAERVGQRAPGGEVETVFIPESSRGTACLSSQVACSLRCSFCHTGAMSKAGLRNLSSGEIVAQLFQQRLSYADFPSSSVDRLVSNIVMMGMGEPLLNYRNVKGALRTIMDGDGLSISKRRITVSTSGVVPVIKKLGDELDVNLAVSLHAVNDELRDVLVPLNKQYPMAELLRACREYPGATNCRKVTFEYVMLRGVNDSEAEARELIRLLKGIPALVNLIPVRSAHFFYRALTISAQFNPWPGAPYECSSIEQIRAFAAALEGAPDIRCTIRWPRGRDIMAACGQLASSRQADDSAKAADDGAADRAPRQADAL